MKKKMKKSFIIPLIAIVALISIVGVGYAMWTIISPINVENVTGNLQTEKLIDKTFTIEVEDSEDIPNIVFGAPKNFANQDTPTDQWFSNDGEGTIENLTVTLKIVLTPNTWIEDKGVDYYLQGRSIKVNLGIQKPDSGNAGVGEFDTAVTNGYVAYPTLNGNTVASGKTWQSNGPISAVLTKDSFGDPEEGKHYYTAEVTITFGWGTKTNKQNPYVFYNEKDNNGNCTHGYDDHHTEASNMMNAIYGLNGLTYLVQFEAVSGNTQSAE